MVVMLMADPAVLRAQTRRLRVASNATEVLAALLLVAMCGISGIRPFLGLACLAAGTIAYPVSVRLSRHAAQLEQRAHDEQLETT